MSHSSDKQLSSSEQADGRFFGEQLDDFRLEVRSILAKLLAGRSVADGAASWMGADTSFSRALAAQGLIGISWPEKYGGGGRSLLFRHVLTEELLAAGAPAAAHWVADRQVGPMLLRFGTEEQRAMFLPRIIAADIFFCIGLSEPDAGSDLASVRTRASPAEGGYRVSGTKLWTSGAHISQYMLTLCRTSDSGSHRHAGLSQFIIPLDSPGITIRPVLMHSGEHHFNEVILDDCFVPSTLRVGAEGQGWAQVTSELGIERSGPERYLSTFPLLRQIVSELEGDPGEAAIDAIGQAAAHLLTLHQMSQAVAELLHAGGDPNVAAAIVKDLGADFEQMIPEIGMRLIDAAPMPESADPYASALAKTLTYAPAISLRGGTREVLRGIVARDLGLR
ncbi:MAG: acyl-CoA dehydrogenase family protein [Sphingopyxis sp.]|nr:acyl-CoA dehydrogenase family protein [Sphingopyxis sp.]